MRRAAQLGDGWLPYFYSPDRYRDSVEKIQRFADDKGRSLDSFQWGFFPYISIYPTVEEAAQVCAKSLGGNYIYDGDFLDVVHRYCIIGPAEQCISRLREYVDAGARHIVFSVACAREDRSRHAEVIAKEIIPGLVEASG
jgi:alkanesulfonate monooxygenase SsuD/methylene tetrahydromethanopterin reductase-like flavin-dependent oxidoreductase (luciferase family)